MAKVVVQKSDLQRAVAICSPFVEAHSAVPILKNLLFRGSCDLLTVTGTDLDVSVTAPLKAVCDGAIQFCLPAAKINSYVRLLPDTELTIETYDNHWTEIRHARGRAKVAGLDPAGFPDIPNREGELVNLPLQALAAAIKLVEISVLHKESQFLVAASLVELSAEGIKLVGTDGHRLSRFSSSVPGISVMDKVLLSISTMAAIRAIAETDPGLDKISVLFSPSDNGSPGYYTFRAGDYSIVSRATATAFPDYHRAIPKAFENEAAFSRLQFLDILRRNVVMVENGSPSVLMSLGSGTVGIRAVADDKAETSDDFPIEYSGPEFTIRVNGKYIMDFVTKATSDALSLHFNKPTSAMEFREVGAVDSRYLVMPMRA